MANKYIFETYKIVLSFILIGVIGFTFQNRYQEKAAERHKELLLFERGIKSFENMSSILPPIERGFFAFRRHLLPHYLQTLLLDMKTPIRIILLPRQLLSLTCSEVELVVPRPLKCSGN